MSEQDTIRIFRLNNKGGFVLRYDIEHDAIIIRLEKKDNGNTVINAVKIAKHNLRRENLVIDMTNYQIERWVDICDEIPTNKLGEYFLSMQLEKVAEKGKYEYWVVK